jgi:hypothetical protein
MRVLALKNGPGSKAKSAAPQRIGPHLEGFDFDFADLPPPLLRVNEKKGPPCGSPFSSFLSDDHSAGTAAFGVGENSSSG